ncbi:YcaO-like family protein [Halorarius litoreus]|uniref:YcaO-like family protein n=1 Tax=Halorarius litoreus TaxID=2962676 RepID=UPI0020CF875B|nr:YcaO-like family protein [Halorarius litoreus]
MHVGIVGGGVAADAVRAGVENAASRVSSVGPDAVGQVDLAVVVGPVGAPGFETANNAARQANTPWLAVELGGIGGHGLAEVEAAVSGFAPEQGCFDCLQTRVAATTEEPVEETPDDADARFAGAIAARETVRLLAGDASPVLGGVIEIPHQQRRFLPVPGCGCDSSRDPSLDRTHTPRDLDAALSAAELALDPRVGVVTEVGEAESWPAPYYLATLADTSGFSDATASSAAAGVSPDWDAAFMKALGEGLERYAAGVYRTGDFERAVADELPAAVSPDTFVTSPRFDPASDDPLFWTQGEHLGSGTTVHLPAEFVVFPPPNVRHRPAITTGLGLGNGGVEAILSGLYEVVERDAAMLAWYSTFEPLGLDVRGAGFETLTRRARSEDLSVTALLLTQDVDVPVVAACVHRDGDWPRFAAGMSADLDPVAAATGALEEALQNWMELRGMGRDGATEESGAIGHHADFPDSTQQFVSPETIIPASSVGPDESFEGEAELAELVARVTDAGLDPYASRLTTRDLESLGFEAVRVVVPSAQPLFTDDAYFGERAERVPEELGFEPRLDREHHPFP